jgi:hypothetical protein
MRERDVKIYGGLLLGSALLSLLAAAHHPEVGAHDLPTALRILAAQTRLIGAVHGILIFLGLVELLGLYGVARLLGVARPLTAAGLLLVGMGFVAMIGAGAINGFAVPAFGSDYRNIDPADIRAATMLLRLCWDLNQALASIGAVAWGIGLLAWSAELARRSGVVRVVGLLGAVAASAIAIGVASGLIRLHVGGFIAVTALLSAWSVAVALLMLTGRLMPAQPDGDASPS